MTKPLVSQRLKDPGESLSDRRRRLGAQSVSMFAAVYFKHLMVAQEDIYDKDPKTHDDAVVLIPAGTDIASADFHKEMWQPFQGPGGQGLRESWIAPRGFAKSAAATLLIAYLAAYKKRKFVVWTSETASQVEELVASFIDELEGNQALLEDFPHLAPKMDAKGQTVKFTDRDVLLDSGFRLSARGAGKSTRGLRRGSIRPDLFICDDSEGENSVGETQYPKVRRWLTRVVSPALAPGGDILWVNTLIDWISVTGAMIRGDEDWTQHWAVHHLQAEWLEAPDGRRVDVATLTHDDGTGYEGETEDLEHRLLWADYWPLERLEAFKAGNGVLAYSFEMLNKSMAEGDKVFRDPDWLKYATFEGDFVYRDDKPRGEWMNSKFFTHVTAIDPAFGGKDYAAVVTVAIFNHDFFVREAWWYKRENVRTEMVAETVRQAEYWNSRIIVVETNAAQILLADEFVRKTRVPIVKMPSTKSKVDRALPVAIRASQGHIYFESGKPLVRTLREVLLQFPGPMADDPVDAFVMAVEGAATLRSKFLVAS